MYNNDEKQSRDLFAFAIDAAELGTFDYDPVKGSFTANDRLKKWFGLPPGNEIGLETAIAVISANDRRRVKEAIAAALTYEGYAGYDIVYTIVHPITQEETIVHAKGKTVFNNLHQPVRFTGILENVTEARGAAARAIQQEQLVRSIVMTAPIGICVLNAETLVSEMVNDSFLEVAGKPYDAIFGKFYWDSFAEARAYYEPALAGVVRDGVPFYANEVELMLIRKGVEEYVFVTFVYTPIKDGNGKVVKVVVWVLENTQQVKARQKIQEATDRLNLVIEASGLGTFDLNLQTGAINYSERFQTLFGYTGDEQITHARLREHLHPDDVPGRDSAFQRALQTGALAYEARITDRSGHLKWIEVRGKIFYDIAGQPALLIGTCSDITALKEQEQQKDFFIGAASHELKTPITSIKGYVQLLQKMYSSGDELLVNSLKVMERQSNTLVNLIGELLDVSKIKLGFLQLNKTVFDMELLLQETVMEVSAANPGYSITLVSEKGISVCADRDRLGQVVVNLLNNAVKYSASSEPIVVSTTRDVAKLTVSVQDNGIGISAHDQERIFERFFRVQRGNQDKYDGFGIGLYISADIIERHGGEIGVMSKPGQGSNFYFAIPV